MKYKNIYYIDLKLEEYCCGDPAVNRLYYLITDKTLNEIKGDFVSHFFFQDFGYGKENYSEFLRSIAEKEDIYFEGEGIDTDIQIAAAENLTLLYSNQYSWGLDKEYPLSLTQIFSEDELTKIEARWNKNSKEEDKKAMERQRKEEKKQAAARKQAEKRKEKALYEKLKKKFNKS